MKDLKYNISYELGKVHTEACIYADKIAKEFKPTPMTVAWNQHGEQKTETYEEGECGFAWVNIKPANCRFAKYLKEHKIAENDNYYRGVSMWIGDYGQSHERKLKYAQEYVKYIEKNLSVKYSGIKSIYAMDRLD